MGDTYMTACALRGVAPTGQSRGIGHGPEAWLGVERQSQDGARTTVTSTA